MVQVAARNLPHLVLGTHDDGELFCLVLLPPGAIADEGGEEAGEAIGLVWPDRFEMATKRFRSHVDAVDRLRIGTGRRRLISFLGLCPQLLEQAFLITGFKRLQPQRSMVRFRERFDPIGDLFEMLRRRVGEDEGIDAERFRQRRQSPGHITPGCRLLAWDHFRLVPFEHIAPAVAFLVTQPIDFFGV